MIQWRSYVGIAWSYTSHAQAHAFTAAVRDDIMDASEDIFLEDIGAELDVNPDEVANVEIKKSMLLKKGEREEILKMLSGLKETGVAQAVVSTVSSEHHNNYAHF